MSINCAILGVGGIGSAFAHYLTRAGYHVHFIVKDELQLKKYKDNQGLRVYIHDTSIQYPLPVSTISNFNTPIDLLFVTLKAYAIFAALEEIIPYVSKQTLIILCNNGLGISKELVTLRLAQPIFVCSHALGAMRIAPFVIKLTAVSELYIGLLSKPSLINHPLLISLQKDFPLAIHFPADIEKKLWLKCAVNCVINPLTTIWQCKNGELLQQENFNSVCDALIHEFLQVANRESISLTLTEIKQLIYKVIHSTADNYSSMYQDIAQKGRTEIDYLNGYIVKCAHAHGLVVPQQTLLMQQILAIS